MERTQGQLLREHLTSYRSVKDAVFVDALPRNSVGKILERQLRVA
ncbi:hypothetical protein [Rhodococcus sp. NPDC003348]